MKRNKLETGIVKAVFDNCMLINFSDGTIKKIAATELFEVAAWFRRRNDFSLKKYYHPGQTLKFDSVCKEKILHSTPLQQYKEQHPSGSKIIVEIVAVDIIRHQVLLKFNEFICFWHAFADDRMIPGTKLIAKISRYNTCASCLPIQIDVKGLILKAKLIKISAMPYRLLFESYSGKRCLATLHSCGLSRQHNLSSYFAVGKNYEIEVMAYKKYVKPHFNHPHDNFIEELKRRNPKEEYVEVPSLVRWSKHNDQLGKKDLLLELAPGVYAHDYVTCTMRGDFWTGTQSLIKVCIDDYNPRSKRIKTYIGGLQKYPYPSTDISII